MRKIISFMLVLGLLMASFGVVVAADETATFKDVVGTKYEDAVTELVGKDIISGYPDGTFRPYATINRAEVCVLIVKLLGVSESDMKKAPASGFPDMGGHAWALDYVNYAASQGIISGYTDGTFRPDGDITYAEIASMLVRALGYKAGDLQGTWPDNFMNKAKELGLMVGIYGSANEEAIRGDVALMVQKALWLLYGMPEENPLANYSGRAFGILLSVAQVLDDKGNVVDEYEFLFGSRVLHLKTNGKVSSPDAATIDNMLNAGMIVGLQMNNGVVTKWGHSGETPTPFDGLGIVKGFENLAGDWNGVVEAKNYVIKVKGAVSGRELFTILEDASIYVAKEENDIITGYKSGSFRDIKNAVSGEPVNHVRIYSITGNNKLIGEIVVVCTKPGAVAN